MNDLRVTSDIYQYFSYHAFHWLLLYMSQTESIHIVHSLFHFFNASWCKIGKRHFRHNKQQNTRILWWTMNNRLFILFWRRLLSLMMYHSSLGYHVVFFRIAPLLLSSFPLWQDKQSLNGYPCFYSAFLFVESIVPLPWNTPVRDILLEKDLWKHKQLFEMIRYSKDLK